MSLLTLLSAPSPAWTPAALPSLAAWYTADPAYCYKDGAASFVSGSAQSLTVASNATVQTGDVDFFFACWVKLTTNNGVETVFGKWAAAGSNPTLEYCVRFNNGFDRFEFLVGDGTGTIGTVRANTLGAPSTGVWYSLTAWFDSTNNTINIAANTGAADSAAFTTVPLASTSAAGFGRPGGYLGDYMNGAVDSAAWGKSPVGGIAGTISTIRTRLYNGGSGLTYADLTGAEKTAWGLVSFWNLDELSGNRADSHGSNTLTSNNSVGVAEGIARGQCGDGDPVALWTDRGGNGRTLTQATVARRPTLLLDAGTGRWYVNFDGVDDNIQRADDAAFDFGAGAYSMGLRCRITSGAVVLIKDTYVSGATGLYLWVTGGNYAYYNGLANVAIGARNAADHAVSATRSAAGAVNTYYDATTGNASTDARVLSNAHPLVIGSGAEPTQYAGGRYYDVVIGGAEWSVADMARLHGYWGFP